MIESSSVKLAIELAEKNPGALVVLRDLQWFSKWPDMLRWFDRNDIRGGKIWALYKDDHNQDLHRFGDWVLEQIFKDNMKDMPSDAVGLASKKFFKLLV